jgi:3-hydroxyisobutyrate dehydrogenase-like beta-hydroxyacid dehydrogenase
MTNKRVGLIGVGLMGHGIGRNLVTKGYPLMRIATVRLWKIWWRKVRGKQRAYAS